MTPAEFRVLRPEFANVTAFPDARIQQYLTLAGLRLRAVAWADMLDHGTELFVSHHLAQARAAERAASAGGAWQGSGAVASKAVDKVSVSYDTGSVALENAGDWNATSYGRQWFQLARMIGAGGLQL